MYFSRGKNKIQNLHGLQSMYDYYNDETASNEVYIIPYEIYASLIKEYYKRMMQEILLGYKYCEGIKKC